MANYEENKRYKRNFVKDLDENRERRERKTCFIVFRQHKGERH